MFYAEVLKHLKKTKIPFLVGGTYALNAYTAHPRATKDLDIFCRAGDSLTLLQECNAYGYDTHLVDERWLAKLKKGRLYVDILYGSDNSVAPVSDEWFKEPQNATVLGVKVQILGPTELIWSKAFVQERHRYDGSDVAHTILLKHKQINWQKLLFYFEQYWEVLLIHLLGFRFIYPSERDCVPKWLMDELLTRLHKQRQLPLPEKKICRGRLFSRSGYLVDIEKWGFSDLIG